MIVASEDEGMCHQAVSLPSPGATNQILLTHFVSQDEYSKFGLKVTCEDGSKPEVKSGATPHLANHNIVAIAVSEDEVGL